MFVKTGAVIVYICYFNFDFQNFFTADSATPKKIKIIRSNNIGNRSKGDILPPEQDFNTTNSADFSISKGLLLNPGLE